MTPFQAACSYIAALCLLLLVIFIVLFRVRSAAGKPIKGVVITLLVLSILMMACIFTLGFAFMDA